MKFEQLRYVFTIYQTGSISRAAKELFLSQPNISNAVKSLEAELGFQIFERTVNGLVFTEKGLDLVYHAQLILEEAERITGLSTQDNGMTFRLLSSRYTPVEDAFVKLFKENEEQSQIRMEIQDCGQFEAIELLSKRQADIAFLISSDICSPSMKSELKRKKLQYHHLHVLQCNVNLSVNHPLIKNGDFSFEKLKQYPFVQYNERGSNQSSYGRLSQLSFIGNTKIIKSDSRVVRSRFVSESDAYGAGVELPPKRSKELGWHCIPIEGLTIDFGYLVHQDFVMNPVFKRYLELLEEEMAFLNENPRSL